MFTNNARLTLIVTLTGFVPIYVDTQIATKIKLYNDGKETKVTSKLSTSKKALHTRLA